MTNRPFVEMIALFTAGVLRGLPKSSRRGYRPPAPPDGAAAKAPGNREDRERLAQHIPDKSFQLVRYYGWYSNPAGAGRGQRLKRAEPETGAADAGGEVIERILRHLGLWEAGVRVESARDPPESMLNRVEAGIRAFDPCLSCSTHADGKLALHVTLVAADGTVLDTVTRD